MGKGYGKPLPSWEDGPAVNEEKYRQLIGEMFNTWNGETNKMSDEEARDAGMALGGALASVFVSNPANVGFAKLTTLARTFSKWSGYRSLDDGGEFIDGFIDAFFASQPKQLTEAPKDADHS